MSPKTEEQNEETRQKRRDKIIQAGLRVFSGRGYHAVKMTDIACEAGMSQGLSYHYFRSKEGLFSELVGMAYQAAAGMFRMISGIPAEPSVKLSMLLEGICGKAFDSENMLYFQMVRQALTMDLLPDGVKKMNKQYLTEIFSILKGMIEQAGISDAEGTVNLFFSMLMGFTIVKQCPAYDGKMPDSATWKRLFKGNEDNG